MAYTPRPKREVSCEICGKVANTHARNWRFCSQRCKDQYWNKALSCADCGAAVWKSGNGATEPRCRACWQAAMAEERHPCGTIGAYRRGCRCADCRRANTDLAVAYQRRVRVKLVRMCVTCDAEFNPRANQITCSPACRKVHLGRLGDHHSRAAHFGVEFEPIDRKAVFDRDGWACGVCGLPVDAALSFPDPGSATLDHIIPMSRGGGHIESNVQLAHFYCNTVKGNREVEAC